MINNRTGLRTGIGSGTGKGAVSANGGTLGGNGAIAGPVIVGGGILEPGDSENSSASLTIRKNLSFALGRCAVHPNK